MRARQSPSEQIEDTFSRRLSAASLRVATDSLFFMLFASALGGSCASAQNATPSPANAPAPQEPTTGSTQQKPDRVTTTVVVHGDVKDNYLSDNASGGSLDNTPIRETPLSVIALSSALMRDQVSRLLSDVVKNDASVGEDYAPVGYYGDFQIRGFPIDLATGLQINGMTIAGEQDVPLENKQRVEIVKGIAGLESGVASSGGMINYVTNEPYPGQRPTIDLATDQRGTAYGATQFAVPGLHGGSGLFITAAGEDIHTYVEGADGWRGMGAADGRWQLGANTQLMTDFEYQHKVERSEAGYQLLGGTTVPAPVYPSVMLGFQPWSKPNTFDAFNAGARLERKLAANWSSPFRRFLQPLAHRRQRHLALRSGTRCRRQLPLPRLALLLLLPRWQLRNLRLPQPRRTAHRCPRRSPGAGPLHHRQGQPRCGRRRLTLPPHRGSIAHGRVRAPRRRKRLSTKYLLRPGRPLRTGRPIHARRLRSPTLRHRSGTRSSARQYRPAGRRPHRARHRFQLHRASNVMAAAVWGHLLTPARSHPLRQLRRRFFLSVRRLPGGSTMQTHSWLPS